MDKKKAIIVLIFLALAGSALTFYGLNLLFSDMANMFMASITVDIVSSLPGFIFSLDFILMTIYVIRLIRRPQYRKRMTLTYLIILGVFSLLGVITSILSGVLVYGSLVAAYPFKGYMIICLVIHSLLLFFSVGAYYNAYKAMPEDEKRRKMSVHYVLYTVVLSIFICFAYYRLGAVLLSPMFIHWRTLYLTWPFYLSMLIPTAILVHTLLYVFGIYQEHPRGGIIHAGVCLGMSVALCLTVILLGMNNTQFISAVSPVLPLERLASLPIDTIVFTLLTIGFSVYELIYSIRYYNRHKEAK